MQICKKITQIANNFMSNLQIMRLFEAAVKPDPLFFGEFPNP